MNHDVGEALAYAKHLLAEHRRVRNLLSDIEQQWSLTTAGPQSSGTIAALCERIEKLRSELARHFAEEEAGGVLEEAVARFPDLGRETVRLEEEHAELLTELDRIIVGVLNSKGTGRMAGDLGEAFMRFVERLKDHEASENRVLAAGFQIDV